MIRLAFITVLSCLGCFAQGVSLNGVPNQSLNFVFNAYPSEAQAANVKVSSGAGTSISNAWTGNTTAGNSILCIGMESAAAVPVFTDAQGNTFTVAGSSATAPGFTVAVATNIIGGTTDTITEAVTSGAAAFACHELKGVPPVGKVWDYLVPAQATSATLSFAAQTALSPNEIAFVAVGMGAGTVNATPGLAGVPAALTTVDEANATPSGGSALSVFYAAHANVNAASYFTQSISLSASETYTAVMVAIEPQAINVSVPDDIAQWDNVSLGAPTTYGTAPTGATVPGVNADVTNLPYQDPCTTNAWIYYPINVSANTQIVPGSSGKNVYGCAVLMPGQPAAVNVNFVESSTSGNACATSPVGMMGGATAALGANMAANGGYVAMPPGNRALMKTATAGDAVCIFTSGQATGVFAYVQQ